MTNAAEATLLIRNIAELATCDSRWGDKPGVIKSSAIAASGDRLIYVGSNDGVRDIALAPNCVEIDARRRAVIPGFVDSHTHLIWLGDRADEYARRAAGESYESIAASGGGIRSTVKATSAGDVSQLTAAALERASRMLRCGTTTVEIKSGYGADNQAEIRELQAAANLWTAPNVPDVVITYLALHAAPEGGRQEFIDSVINEGLPQAAKYCEFADAFCEKGAYTVEECEKFLRAAQQLGLGLKLHAEQLTPSGAAQLAARLGAVSADHLEYADEASMRALAKGACVGVLLPGASLTLGGPPPPGRQLLDAGVTVAIATDCNPGTCYAESMSLMLSLAVATAGMTPAEALNAATAGGAAAVRRSDRGVLEVGKRCDLVILKEKRWLDVAYHLGGDPVDQVILAGSPIATV